MAEIIYSDVNQFSPTDTGKEVLTNAETIYQSIRNILSTRTGEKIFDPEFGVDLEDYLFDQMDDVSELEIFREITIAINSQEPRVRLINSLTKVQANKSTKVFEVTLVFEIVGLEGQNFELTGEILPPGASSSGVPA